jgi:Methyltransferase domain
MRRYVGVSLNDFERWIMKTKMITIVTLLKLICLPLFSNEAQVSEPYRSIVDLPFDPHGWFGNAQQLDKFLQGKNIKTVIEVGSWLGASTRYIAASMADDGVLYAIDTWLGSPQEAVHLQDSRLPYLYQLFLSNIKHAGLCHKVVPIRMTSQEASNALNVKADLIYLDGAHDTQSVCNDILSWYPHLNPYGIICGDDWKWHSVRVAVSHCAGILNKTIRVDDNLWWYEN